MNGHARLDARSLACHQAIAAKLLKQPDLVERAKSNLARWRALDDRVDGDPRIADR
jgi:hypothetical protein